MTRPNEAAARLWHIGAVLLLTTRAILLVPLGMGNVSLSSAA
jgi:hypothetical protein